MYRYAPLALCFALSTAADAGGRGSLATESRPSSSSTDSVSTAATKGVVDTVIGSGALEVEFLGMTDDGSVGQIYDIAVDGDEYMVEIRNNSKQSYVCLYDENGDIIVGHVASSSGALIFDDEGMVHRGARGEISLSAIEDYGDTAALLTNPAFLATFLEANGETFGGGDDVPPGMWWWVGPAVYLVARCLDVGIEGDLDGVTSWSVGWDC